MVDIEALQADILARAEVRAGETLSRARAAADEITRQATIESEQIKQQAHRGAFEQGSREGYAQGYREGKAKAEEEEVAIRSEAREVLEQAEKIRRRTLEALEQEVIGLAREIAEGLLLAELSLNPETVLNVVVEALRLVADRLNVILYVNPAEAELVENKTDELKSLLPARAELQVIKDASILPGGCKIETEQGRVDATMEKRREELLNALYWSDK
jgi:flagellar assembly protein FliH